MLSTTALSDYALALVTAVLGAILIRGSGGRLPVRLWGWAFLALAAAGAAGGVWHAYEHTLDAGTLVWIWRVDEWCIGLFGLGAVAATALAAFTGARLCATLSLAALAFVVYAAWTAGHDAFRFVLIWDAAVMVFVLAVHLTRLRRLEATPWIVAGIAASAVAAAAQASTVAIGPLDHNDIFHLVQLAGVVLFFGGARLIPATPLQIPSGFA